MIRVLFVCTGNICRSPMAEYVFRDLVDRAGLADQFEIDSAGISDEEVGNTIHRGTVGVLRRQSIPHDSLRDARQITHEDFRHYDYLLGMDRSHIAFMRRFVNGDAPEIALFLSYARAAGLTDRDDVPDPWYDGQYDRTYDLILKGSTAFLNHLRATRRV